MKTLNIKFTTDVHGYFYPTNYRSVAPVDMGLFGLVGDMYPDSGNCLVLDGGDMLQGSPLVQYVRNNDMDFGAIADMVNNSGYTHITLGNHDFNNGYDKLAEYLDKVTAKVVCCNVVDSTGTLPIVPYDIATLDNGLRVGIVGVVTDYVNVWEDKEHLTKLQVLDVLPAVTSAYNAIKDNCDISVCIYHGGYEHGIDQLDSYSVSSSGENVGLAICHNLGFDILLTGHQHMNVSGRDVFGTYTLQIPANAVVCASVDVVVDDNGKLDITSKFIPSSKPSSKLCQQYDALQQGVQSWLDQSVGELAQSIDNTDPLYLMTNGWDFANLCSSVVLAQTGADFACTSLMNSPYPLSGQVTIRDIVSSYPFANTIDTISILGSDIKLALEQVATFFVVCNGELAINDKYTATKLELYNFDFYYGLDYTFDISKPMGSRVVELACNGAPLDMNKHYTLSLTSYRSSGTGGYPMFVGCNKLSTTAIEVQEMLINHITQAQCISLPSKPNYKVIF